MLCLALSAPLSPAGCSVGGLQAGVKAGLRGGGADAGAGLSGWAWSGWAGSGAEPSAECGVELQGARQVGAFLGPSGSWAGRGVVCRPNV